MLSEVLIREALLLHFACKDVLNVQKEQLICNRVVHCSESRTLIAPITGTLQAKPCSHAFFPSQAALGWWLYGAVCEDKYRSMNLAA